MPTRVERPLVHTRTLLNRQRATLDAVTLKWLEKKVKAREARLRRAAKKRLQVKLYGARNVAYVTPAVEQIKVLQVQLRELMLTVRNPKRSKKVQKLKALIAKLTTKIR